MSPPSHCPPIPRDEREQASENRPVPFSLQGAGGACKEQPNPTSTVRGERSSQSPVVLARTHRAELKLGHMHPEIDTETAWRDRSDNIICLCCLCHMNATKIKAVWACTPTSKLPVLHTNSLRCLCSGDSPMHDRKGASHVLHPTVPATSQRMLLWTRLQCCSTRQNVKTPQVDQGKGWCRPGADTKLPPPASTDPRQTM